MCTHRHACIHTSTHTYIYVCGHRNVSANIITDIQAYIPAYIPTYLLQYLVVLTFLHAYVRAIHTYPLTCLFAGAGSERTPHYDYPLNHFLLDHVLTYLLYLLTHNHP